ncbi:MAG: hypothetical protein CTY19_07645 [Methylomonas sp.]|jgi:hypothetical protein|nr:MAG: hypothetical protein CTY19_07645 [Methylomonas sp.]
MMTKEERERLIFQLFAESSDLLSSGDRVESKSPPEPDVLLTQSDGSNRAFELVEILDQDYSSLTQSQLTTKSDCYVYLNAMQEPSQTQFIKKYANADIHIEFEDSLTRRRRQQSLEQVFDFLLRLPEEASGEVSLEGESVQNLIKYLNISRSNLVGPLFDIQSLVWVGDPTIDLIRKKLEKNYKTSYPISLLAYIETNPMYPDDVWLAELDTFLCELKNNCQFEFIYIFDCASKTIKRSWCRDSQS